MTPAVTTTASAASTTCAERTGTDLTDLDLHRPFVDDVTFACVETTCSGTMRRVAPVLDAWFDSGSMPTAQHHHPFADAEALDRSFPADFICEAIDQTRGWFYSLLAVNALVFDATPYRNVVCLALIVDEHGQKMSKSKGNVIAPFDIFDTLGADALRWYFFSAGQPWTPRRVYPDGIREATRQTLLTLWNVWSFFATYADLDDWSPSTGGETAAPSHVLDRWILSELDDTVVTVTDALEGFDAFAGATRLAAFVDDLSNWYVRRSRPRFWKASDPVAHATLHECLVTVSQLMAPFTPFLADELYTSLTGASSVHLSDWPEARGRHDPSLAAGMRAARRLVALGRAARTDAKVKVRQPLPRGTAPPPGGGARRGRGGRDQLRAQRQGPRTHRHTVRAHELDRRPQLPHARPPPRPEGQRDQDGVGLGRRLRTPGALERDGFVIVAGERLDSADVEVRADRHETLALVEDDGWAVALDLELDDLLRAEGIARELVRALNDARKAAGLAIADRVVLTLAGDETIHRVVQAHREDIATEVLAVRLDLVDSLAGAMTLEVGGTTVGVRLEVVDPTGSERRARRTGSTGGRRGSAQRQRGPRPGSSSNSASKKAFIAASASSSGGPNGESSGPFGAGCAIVGGPSGPSPPSTSGSAVTTTGAGAPAPGPAPPADGPSASPVDAVSPTAGMVAPLSVGAGARWNDDGSSSTDWTRVIDAWRTPRCSATCFSMRGHVGGDGIAHAFEPADLLGQGLTSTVDEVVGLGPRRRQELRRLLFRLGHQRRRLGLGGADGRGRRLPGLRRGRVGGALGHDEQRRGPSRLLLRREGRGRRPRSPGELRFEGRDPRLELGLRLRGLRRPGLGILGLGRGLPELVLQLCHRRADPLEEVVDLVRVVTLAADREPHVGEQVRGARVTFHAGDGTGATSAGQPSPPTPSASLVQVGCDTGDQGRGSEPGQIADQELQPDEQHDRREVERHRTDPHRRQDRPDRGQDRFGDAEQDPLDAVEHTTGGREPAEHDPRQRARGGRAGAAPAAGRSHRRLRHRSAWRRPGADGLQERSPPRRG